MPGTFGTTTRNALRFLKGTSLVSDVDEGFQRLAEDVDEKMASYSQGTHAARPAAGQPNRFYKETDTGLIFHDTGTVWEQIARLADVIYPQAFALNASTPQAVNNIRAGATVRLSATLIAAWSTASEGSYESVLKRDGAVIWTPGQRQRFSRQEVETAAKGIATVEMVYIEAAGGNHTYEWTLTLYGTEISAVTVKPTLIVG